MRLLIVGALLAGVLFGNAARGMAATADETAVLTADRALLAALEKRDSTAVRKLLDPRLNWTDLHGKTQGKKVVKQALPQPADQGAQPKLRFYGRVAVLTSSRDTIHVLRIWIRRQLGWRAIVHHEVAVTVPAAAAAEAKPSAPAAAHPCDNPCKAVPYRPRSPDEQALIQSWQALETAVASGNGEAWAAHVADEFVIVGNTRLQTKAERTAAVSRGGSTPAPLVSAELYDFDDCIIMAAEHQPAAGKPVHVTRVFVRRNSAWLLALSYQTIIEDAPAKTN